MELRKSNAKERKGKRRRKWDIKFYKSFVNSLLQIIFLPSLTTEYLIAYKIGLMFIKSASFFFFFFYHIPSPFSPFPFLSSLFPSSKFILKKINCPAASKRKYRRVTEFTPLNTTLQFGHPTVTSLVQKVKQSSSTYTITLNL